MKNPTPCKRKWTENEIRQWYREHPALTCLNTYANPEDSNILVKKPRGQGYTINFANPKACLLLIAFLAAVFAIVFFFNSTAH